MTENEQRRGRPRNASDTGSDLTDIAPRERSHKRAPSNCSTPGSGKGGRAFRRLGRTIRVVLSLALLAYVLTLVDWSEVTSYGLQMDPLWLLLFLALTPFLVGISVLKWQVLLAAKRCHIGLGNLFGIYVLGQFYNTVLPTSVGGDAIRIIALSKKVGDTRLAVASVVADRFTGITVSIAMAVVAVIASAQIRGNLPLILLVGASMVAYLVLAVLIFDPRAVSLLRKTAGQLHWLASVVEKTEQFQASLREYRHNPVALAKSLGLSVLFNVGAIVNVYVACRGLGEEVPFMAMGIAMPIILSVGLLPLSPGGIGVTQWAYVASFTALGLTAGIGFSAAILIAVKTLLWAATGYLVLNIASLVPEFKPRSPLPAVDTSEQRSSESKLQ